jgi:tetratricopeptide (TPR) repeat protein
LREAVLDELQDESKQYLHGKVAEALEHVYGDAPDHVAGLAHHWGLAGNQEKERQYAELAGEYALAHGAYQDAATFLARALALQDPQTSTPMQTARLERQLGQASYGLGDLPATRQHLRRAVAILGWPVPTTTARLAVGMLGQVLRQILHRLRPRGPSQAPRPRYLEAAGAYISLAELAVFTNETVPAINAVLRSLNLAESGGSSPELATAYAGAAYTAALATVHGIADNYTRRARDTARKLAHPPTMGYVLFVTGTYEQFLGRWDAGEKAMAEAIEIFDRVGDQARWAAASVIQAHRHYFQGRFAASAAIWDQVYESAIRRNHLQHICWALSWKAALQIRMHPADQLAEAIGFTEQATALLSQTIARSDEIVNNGVQCVTHLHRGEAQSAYDVARQASSLISESPPSAPANFLGYAGAAEVYLTQWESNREASGPENPAMIDAARQAVKDLNSYARVFHLGKPRAYIWQGLFQWLSGSERKASTSWSRAVTAARSMQMPYDEALARYMIGRHSEEPVADKQLARAIEMLDQMEVSYDLGLAQAALERRA